MKKTPSFAMSLSLKKKSKPAETGKIAVGMSSVKKPHRPALGGDTARKDDRTSIKIVANVDVGFGNHLYIRGDGCGLSWEKGAKMTHIGDTHWEWECQCKANKMCFEFKTLINDQIWSTGDNYVAIGKRNEVFPVF
ncbi:MAG: hypothetical protein LBT64_01685 [Puniceicoccales bacterium]|nr:hypothetical protein [Puniceicoccales bacterium]